MMRELDTIVSDSTKTLRLMLERAFEAGRLAALDAVREHAAERLKEISIDTLEIGGRGRNALRRCGHDFGGCETIWDVVRIGESALSSFENFGAKSLRLLKSELRNKYSITLRP
jgi:DNA-directed RNA polymerase alpha subunit